MKFVLLLLIDKARPIGVKKFEGSKYGVLRIGAWRKTKHRRASSKNSS